MEYKSIRSKIQNTNNERDKITLGEYACLNVDGLRYLKEDDEDEIRPSFSHDADRIVHSKSYTRYIDKTQVFSFFENDHIQHRVLHVQLVSKIARSIGRSLSLNEDLIEAIALGHDLGHTPFGHDGERFLNAICIDNGIGYFAHNAQSMRLLTKIEKDGHGLNLTLQVLDGILCHNGESISEKYEPRSGKDWDTLIGDCAKCFSEEDYTKTLVPMTLEGCVVRISDVIAYIGRDLEDALTLNVIQYEDIPDEIIQHFSLDDHDNIHSKMIKTLVSDLIKCSYGHNYLALSDANLQILLKLKQFNKTIYANETIMSQVLKLKDIFERIYQYYYDNIDNEECAIHNYCRNKSHAYQQTDKKRIIVDCIAGMTDDFMLNEYSKIYFPKKLGYALEKRPPVPITPPSNSFSSN